MTARKSSVSFVCFLAFAGLGACGSSSTGSSDPSASDGGASDAASSVDATTDAASTDATTFGEPCTVGDDAWCGEGFFCLMGPAGNKTGFCSKTCKGSGACDGVPEGMAAFCVVTDVDTAGDKGCAFACKEGGNEYPCPGELQCETTEDPAGSGQYLCLP
ncbi:MAG TPA: hypothetical protein VF407_01085 [Polyangiaceae bacterium]